MIERNGKNYVCKLDLAFEIIRGKWKAVILCHLLEGTKRFFNSKRRRICYCIKRNIMLDSK
ncbi:helix-turn-helix transcriptional regulator [Clostridium gasigenes]|nr:winged helix-turn-helix transcriptional regulator [Clostridium gasigenes]MBU3130986.1 winged helix-turn-helix transcriptional regulator [Clostridium gasigenes]NKF07272.1 helix-turn-helix transcriptional regulator [Clostridium gasigenes]QSW18249.1 helix-turn-helix transcriptional regulator [Clostridium gasigenes]